ncbi:hypothetical protein OV079_13480 [Nannocystis pusilla]|uniref:FAD-binding FR-type domain-containing protein n=1 Tax=Nannocystis pusilla TaxID=889268 RepID=A0A9X3EMM6_9BACT|nr:hypothetical protein [Nannocystis pusilla]MCY1006545.1 hypothetical protein [Nannocystis pusilla]
MLELAAAAPTPVADAVPGQFVMLRGEWGRELLNPRAFSILDAPDPRHFSILAKAYGEGTRRLKRVEPGDRLVTTGPLGAAFPRPDAGVRDLLVAGGVGLPPLHFFARMAHRAGLRDRSRCTTAAATATTWCCSTTWPRGASPPTSPPRTAAPACAAT